MSDYLADYLIDCVRVLLKQHEPFASMSRDDLDNGILADLEHAFQRELEDWIEGERRGIRYEIEAEVETGLEFKRELKATLKAPTKKAKRRNHTKAAA
jgi:hypothetical protein